MTKIEMMNSLEDSQQEKQMTKIVLDDHLLNQISMTVEPLTESMMILSESVSTALNQTQQTLTRVVPAHSFKYAATLQEEAGKSTTNPLLIRVDVNSGHGASNTKKNIETMAYIYSFIWYNMGYQPTFKK